MDFPKSVPSVGLVDGEFVDEDVVAGTPGSLIPAQWGNAVTEEILNVIESAGLTPDEDNNAQLLAALNLKISAAIPGSPPDASTTEKGLVELATNLETQTGTDTVRAVTPAGLASRTATDTRAGIIEIATDTEVQAGADTQRAITPASLKAAYGLGDSTLVTDLNNAGPGYFYAAPGAANSPGSGIVFGQTRGAGGTAGKSQSCIDISTRVAYKRAYNGGSWSAWSSVIDSATLATETVTGVAKVATQALTNQGVDDATIVTPKKLKAAFPAGNRVKAWCNFNGTGTPAIRSASGFSSVIDNGVGDYTLMFTTPESDANYAAVASGTTTSAPITGISCVGVYARTTTSVSISTSASATSRTDFANIDVAVFSAN
ncbi:hypothetical protein [Pseudomonas alvandae]|uniref:hypothetical protein n=1 Tax=Pseudomonas canavaninivorans TaxID=2842348 RepID=UPI0021607FDB|nr:hypothetical protein [Pseudomonas canavaninivorans]UVM74936.1 hypothetical protein LOY40_12535 [Pseudomonas canavaninivorans]